MEDFRSKIKNHKAVPNNESWERLLITKEKKALAKAKSILTFFFMANLVCLSFFGYNYFTSDPSNKLSSDYNNINQPIKNIDDQEIQNKEIQNNKLLIQEYLSKNESANTEILELKNQIFSLQNSILKKNKENDYLKNELSNIENQEDNIDFGNNKHETTLAQNIQNIPSENLLDNEIKVLRRPRSLQTYRNVQTKLVHNKAPSLKIFNHYNAFNIIKPKNWYVGIGTKRTFGINDRQIKYTISLQRKLNKFFDLGLRYNYSNVIERATFSESNDIRDFWKIKKVNLFVRCNALSWRNFNFYIDNGMEYSLYNVQERNSLLIDNELIVFPETRIWDRIDYKFSLGLVYDLNKNFTFGIHSDFEGDVLPDLVLYYSF